MSPTIGFGWTALLTLSISIASAQTPPPPIPNPPPYPPYPDPGPTPNVAPWPATGVAIATSQGAENTVIGADDHAHGAYFAWTTQERRASASASIHVTRIGPDGNPAPGWPVNGRELAPTRNDPHLYACVSDGSTGVYVAWSNYVGPGRALFVQRLTPTGEIVPGWPESGLQVCASGTQEISYVFSDHQDGLQIFWVGTNGTKRGGWVHHLGPDGVALPGWPACGKLAFENVVVSDPCCGASVAGSALLGVAIWPDGALVKSGTSYWWNECHLEPDGSSSCRSVYAGCCGRYDFQGPGAAEPQPWPPDAGFCSVDCGNLYPELLQDEAGGLIVHRTDSVTRVGVLGNPSWTLAADHGALLPAGDGTFHLRVHGRYARILNDGTVAPGWSLATPVSPFEPPGHSYWGHLVAPDGDGGMFVGWLDSRAYPYNRARVARLLRGGIRDPRFPADGFPLASDAVTGFPALVSDRRGNMIVAWADDRSGEFDLYAQRFTTDVPVSTSASRISAMASPGRVEIVWSVTSRTARLSVERRGPDGGWRWLGDVEPDGVGRVVWVDTEVNAGLEYGYRLMGSGQVLDEVAIRVPSGLRLSFEGASPNPTSRGIESVFTVPSVLDVEISLADVAGRLIRERTIGQAPAGRHRVSLSGPGELTPGTYFLEFRAGGSRMVRRAVVVR